MAPVNGPDDLSSIHWTHGGRRELTLECCPRLPLAHCGPCSAVDVHTPHTHKAYNHTQARTQTHTLFFQRKKDCNEEFNLALSQFAL